MNTCAFVGRLTADPTKRSTNNGTVVASYTLAVDRDKDNADFIPVTAYGKGAEFASQWFRKGMRVAVVGRIQTGSYTARDGSKRYTWDVIADRQEFAQSKAENGKAEEAEDGFINIPDGVTEDLPFH